MKKLIYFLFVIVLSSNLSFAQEAEKKQSPVRLLVGGALEIGGDPVAEIHFTDGETQSVKAGQGGSLAVGGQFQLPKFDKFLLRATVGYKYVTTAATNAHIRLTRIPLIATANWMVLNKLRVGAGIVNQQNIKFKADGLGENVNLKSSTGPTFEIAWGEFGLTYTALKYKDQDNFNYSANAIGISFSTTIGRRKS